MRKSERSCHSWELRWVESGAGVKTGYMKSGVSVTADVKIWISSNSFLWGESANVWQPGNEGLGPVASAGVQKESRLLGWVWGNLDKLWQLGVRIRISCDSWSLENLNKLSQLDDFGSAVTSKYKECESNTTSGFIENLGQMSRLWETETADNGWVKAYLD